MEEHDSKKNLAAVFSFAFEHPNNGKKVFRLLANTPIINFSKCKTLRKKGTVDVRIKIIFEAVWLGKEEVKKQIIYEEEFDFNDLKLSGRKEYRKNPDKPLAQPRTFSNNEMIGSWIPFCPNEAALNIRCEIVESDEAGKRLEQANRLLKDNKEAISGMVDSDSNSK